MSKGSYTAIHVTRWNAYIVLLKVPKDAADEPANGTILERDYNVWGLRDTPDFVIGNLRVGSQAQLGMG